METKGRCLLLDDMVAEILDRWRRVIAWNSFSRSGTREDEEAGIEERTEVRRIGEEQAVADFDGGFISAGEWAPPGKTEMCDTVLQIERMIFRGLVAETIGGLLEASDGIGRHLLPGKLQF